MSLRAKTSPLYITAWSTPELKNYELFLSGQKFILTGQKGTGKTAILRHMESASINNGYRTEFVVFKNEILNEANLLNIENPNIAGSVIEEEKLKGGKFYYHAVKRIMVSLILSKIKENAEYDGKLNVDNKDYIEKLFGKSGKEAIRLAFDSIVSIAGSVKVDIEKASSGRLNVDPGQLIKKSNDDLLNSAVRLANIDNTKARIFFDEMHFAFRDKETLRSDAALVRDTVLAAQALNERFAEEGIDIAIIIALRKEFLDQPEIAQADIVHVVESYGESISWENHPSTIGHPIFDFISLRFKASLKSKFSKHELFKAYLNEVDPLDLLEYTWSKPRDIIRFFKTAQTIDGNTIVINSQKYKTIIRQYSTSAWQEIKSALGAFVPTDALPLLELGLKSLIPGQFDGSIKIDNKAFQKAIKPAFDKSTEGGAKYNINEFCKILGDYPIDASMSFWHIGDNRGCRHVVPKAHRPPVLRPLPQ